MVSRARYTRDSAAGAMLEHIAGLGILAVKARGFAVAVIADGLVGRDDGFHRIVSFHQLERETCCRLRPLARRAARMQRALRAIDSSIIRLSTVRRAQR